MSVALLDPVARDWRFPRWVSGVAVLLRYAGGQGLAPGDLLAGSGLRVADVAVADREVTADQELSVVRALLRHRGELSPRELGERVGASYHLSSFGIFGFAMLASRTLLDAVNLATRYLDLSFTFALPHAELAGDDVRVVVEGGTLPADVRDFLVARDTAAIAAVLAELLPGLPVRVEAGAGADGRASAVLTFPVAELERPLPQGNPQSVVICESLCADLVTRRRERSGTAQQVRVLIAQELHRGAPAAAVAAGLGLSERTLRRRLAAAGTSYSELLDEVRATLAGELLDSQLTVDDVALRLGYAEASSFIHAHRRWTGRTPRQRTAG